MTTAKIHHRKVSSQYMQAVHCAEYDSLNMLLVIKEYSQSMQSEPQGTLQQWLMVQQVRG